MIAELFPTTRAEAALRAARQQVEVVGLHLRISGEVQLGTFHRLADYVNLQTSGFTLHAARLLNRRGMPTADVLREVAIHTPDVTAFAQRYSPPPEPSMDASDESRAEKERYRMIAVTPGHIIEGTVEIYAGAEVISFLQASDPPFLPLVDARLRWLADRRVKTTYSFLLLNRLHIVGVTVLGQIVP